MKINDCRASSQIPLRPVSFLSLLIEDLTFSDRCWARISEKWPGVCCWERPDTPIGLCRRHHRELISDGVLDKPPLAVV